MLLGIQGVDFEQKLVENGREIEAEIRTTLFDDFVSSFDAFWSHFGSQHGTKMASKINAKIDGFLDRSWKGSGAQRDAITILSWAAQGSRGGVGERLKPLPRGKRGSGKKDSLEGVSLNHLSPRGLVVF